MNRKIAKTEKEAWNMQETLDDVPHCWIQWNGTDVCMDFHCACGKMPHIDASFAYHIKCPHCNRVYFCNGHIELIEIEDPNGVGCIETAERDDD